MYDGADILRAAPAGDAARPGSDEIAADLRARQDDLRRTLRRGRRRRRPVPGPPRAARLSVSRPQIADSYQAVPGGSALASG